VARKRKQDDPLTALMETATKAKLVDLLVLVASSRPAVRRECIDYLTRHAALSHNQKKQSEGEKLLAMWSELAPDLDELDAYGGGDYDADFIVSHSPLQGLANKLSRRVLCTGIVVRLDELLDPLGGVVSLIGVFRPNRQKSALSVGMMSSRVQ